MTSAVMSQQANELPNHCQSPWNRAESGEMWAEPGTSETTVFTIFIVLPTEEVCTVRNLPSGISVFELKGRLELVSGIPSHLYALIYPDGEELPDHQRLLTQENIRDGYLLRMQLYDNWESLYLGISKNNIEHVFHSGGVHLRGNIVISQHESQRYDGVVRDRAAVALFLSSFLGLHRMTNMLLSVGADVNGTTPLGRTPMHAAVARDNISVLDLLVRHGASFQKSDNLGFTPLDVAKEMSSGLCAKRLRIMQLNLRGMNGQTIGKQSQNSTLKNTMNNSQTKNDDASLRRAETEANRMRSSTSLSFVSDDSSFPQKGDSVKPIHKSRKNISSSAPVKDSDMATSWRDRRLLTSRASSRASDRQVSGKGKRVVTWKDIPDNDYWEVIEYMPGESKNPHEAVNIKPMKIIHQKKILKFADDKMTTHPVPTRETETGRLSTLTSDSYSRPLRQSSKLNKISRKPVTSDELRSMRRKIGIAANHGRSDDPPHNTEAFNRWLARKRIEKARAEESDSSDDSQAESEEDVPKLAVFNKWVRKHNRVTQRGYTPGNRFIPGLIEVGSTRAGDPRNPPPDDNIAAHRIWQKSRAFGKAPIRRQTVQDFMAEKRKLEEKRKRLLLTAISYDEWMDNVEERKYLIQQILKADISDMKRLEDEKFKGRLGVNSFENWKERLKKREAEDKRRREIQKRYEEEQMKTRQGGKSSAAVPFEEWLKRKRVVFSRDLDLAADDKNASPRSKLSQEELESVYENLLLQKHRQEAESFDEHPVGERKVLQHLVQDKETATATS